LRGSNAEYLQLIDQWWTLRDQIADLRRQEREARRVRQVEFWDTLIRDVQEGKRRFHFDPNDLG
jgi:hypothetical protein